MLKIGQIRVDLARIIVCDTGRNRPELFAGYVFHQTSLFFINHNYLSVKCDTYQKFYLLIKKVLSIYLTQGGKIVQSKKYECTLEDVSYLFP